jgi:hypothetical protein
MVSALRRGERLLVKRKMNVHDTSDAKPKLQPPLVTPIGTEEIVLFCSECNRASPQEALRRNPRYCEFCSYSFCSPRHPHNCQWCGRFTRKIDPEKCLRCNGRIDVLVPFSALREQKRLAKFWKEQVVEDVQVENVQNQPSADYKQVLEKTCRQNAGRKTLWQVIQTWFFLVTSKIARHPEVADV